MMLEAAVGLSMALLAALAIVMTALAASAVATSVLMTAMGIAETMAQDNDLLTSLASTPLYVMLLVLMHTGSLTAITELMQHVNIMMIIAAI